MLTQAHVSSVLSLQIPSADLSLHTHPDLPGIPKPDFRSITAPGHREEMMDFELRKLKDENNNSNHLEAFFFHSVEELLAKFF